MAAGDNNAVQQITLANVAAMTVVALDCLGRPQGSACWQGGVAVMRKNLDWLISYAFLDDNDDGELCDADSRILENHQRREIQEALFS